MGFLNKQINTKQVKNQVLTLQDSDLYRILGLDTQSLTSEKLGEATLLTCLKFLSENISKLNISEYTKDKNKGKEKQFGFDMDYILNTEPNPFTNASDFWACVELQRNYYGNSYVYCERDKQGKLKNLWILPHDEITPYIDDAGIFGKDKNALWYIWNDSKNKSNTEINPKSHKFMSSEILHFTSGLSWDGVTGLSIVTILAENIAQGKYGKSYLKKLYQNNMFGDKVILQYTGDLSSANEQKLASKIESYSTSDVNSGKFIPLPLGIEAKTLTMKLSDAEFSVLNQANSLQIAAAFGIKPNIINDYSKSSYANSISQQLDFLVNTLQPILKKYSQELTRKLIPTINKNKLFLEHDTKDLLKLDPSAQMDYLQKGVNNFMITPNEGREDLGLPYSDDPIANRLIGNGNYITLDKVVAEKGGVKE